MFVILFFLIFFLCYKYTILPHQIFFKKYYSNIYIETVSHLDIIKNEKLVICLLIYNSDIQKIRSRINYLISGFSEYKIVIYGLDSNTETIKALYNWKHCDINIHLIDKIFTNNLSRIIRIATLRNEVLKYLRQLNFNNNWKILVYDSDHLGPMSKNGLIDSIKLLNQCYTIYAICASGTISVIPGVHFLYDWFAYRDLRDLTLGKKLHYNLPIYDKIISGFSGASLYRWSDLKNFNYTLNSKICEHVSLHRKMKDYFDCKYDQETYMIMSKKWHIYVGTQPSVE